MEKEIKKTSQKLNKEADSRLKKESTALTQKMTKEENEMK